MIGGETGNGTSYLVGAWLPGSSHCLRILPRHGIGDTLPCSTTIRTTKSIAGRFPLLSPSRAWSASSSGKFPVRVSLERWSMLRRESRLFK